MSESANRAKIPFLLAIAFFFTGAACLALEVVWARSLTLIFGGTVASVSTVIAAFMAGLGAGGYFFGRLADRSDKPELLFTRLALAAAIVTPLVHWTLPAVRLVYGALLMGDPTTGFFAGIARFFLAFLLLVVPAALMGGTLPALSRALVRIPDVGGKVIGRLYAVNTLGGAAGCLAASFWFIGTIGLQTTVFIAAASQAVGAGLSWLAVRIRRDLSGEKMAEPESSPEGVNRIRLIAVLAMLSGFAALSYEVLWTRVLGVYLRNSPHTFALILTVYLVGIAIGSAVYSTWLSRRARPLLIFGFIQVAVGLLALALTPIFGALPDLLVQLRGSTDLPLQRLVYPSLLLSGVVVLVPAVLMGISLPLLLGVVTREGRAVGRQVGYLYLANTIGCIAGSLAAGFLLIPLIGTHSGNALTVMVSFAAALLAFTWARREGVRFSVPQMASSVLAVAAVLVALNPSWFKKVLPPSFGRMPGTRDRLVFHQESVEGTVTVIENQLNGEKAAFINNSRVCGSSYDAIKTVHMLGALPVLSHPEPKDALIIGLGIGTTTAVVASWDDINIDCVEICPAVAGVLPFYTLLNHDVLSKPQVRLIAGDGRNFVAFSDKKYDLISCDPTHPALGSGTLYALEHYQACRERLKEGGVIAQYLPLHRMAPEDFRTALATFTTVFPDGALFMGVTHGVMLGSNGPLKFDLSRFESGLASSGMRRDLAMTSIHEPLGLLGCFVAGGEALRSFAGGEARLNTDDLPLLDYAGSRGLVRDTWLENMEDLLGLPPGCPEIEASDEQRELLQRSCKVKRLLSKGLWHVRKGDREKAMETYLEAAALLPDDPEVGNVLRSMPGRRY